jgi:cellulose biosynthesis protein BcsQ
LFGEAVYEEVQQHVPHYDDIVIDTRGTEAHNVEMYAALRAADLVVTPIRTSLFDSATTIEMGKTLRLVRQINPGVRAVLMLNDVSPNPRSTRDVSVRKQLREIPGFDGLLAAQVTHRTAFERVAEMGLSVAEFGNDKRAAGELAALAAEVWQ